MHSNFKWESIHNINNVNYIVFTGGEPFLNIDVIKYALSVVKKKKISIYSFFLATNGKLFKEDNIHILNKWMEYVSLCNYEKKTISAEDYVLSNEELFGYGGVAVSRDIYHEPIPYKNYLRYLMLSYYINSKEQNETNSKYIIKEGMAKENGIGTFEKPKSEIYIEANCKDAINGIEFEDIDVSSILYISAKGEVLGDCDCSYEHQAELSIGNINDNSLIEILKNFYIEKNFPKLKNVI